MTRTYSTKQPSTHPAPSHLFGKTVKWLASWAVLSAFVCMAASVQAQSDAGQPMEVEADSLEYNEKTRVSQFSGNVQVKKGSIVMRGSYLIVSDRKGEGQTGELRGSNKKVAYFKQNRVKPGESIEGQAHRIKYLGAQDKVLFLGNARLRRYIGNSVADQITGETITYNNRTGVFSVNGGAKTDASTSGKPASGRVRVVLTPRK